MDCRYGFVVEHLLKTKVCGAVGMQEGARWSIGCTVGKKYLCVLGLKKYMQKRYFLISSLCKDTKKTGESSQNFAETHFISELHCLHLYDTSFFFATYRYMQFKMVLWDFPVISSRINANKCKFLLLSVSSKYTGRSKNIIRVW